MHATGGGGRVYFRGRDQGAVGQRLDSAVWSPGEEQGLQLTLLVPSPGGLGQGAGCAEWWSVEQVVRTQALNFGYVFICTSLHAPSRRQSCLTLCNSTCQAPVSMRFLGQAPGAGCHALISRDLLDPRIKLRSLAIAGRFFTT